MTTPAEQISAEFAKAKAAVREALSSGQVLAAIAGIEAVVFTTWSDAEARAALDKARAAARAVLGETTVLAALSRAEAVALLAVGATLCPPLPPDHIAVEPGELWP